MNTIESKLTGVWPALLTPVDKNGSPDYEQLRKLVEVLIAEGLDGLYILGSTGQGFLFDEAERTRITAAVMEAAAARVPVIAQVGALNTHESVRLAKEAQKLGVFGISTVAPIYYPSGGGRGMEHYRAIASSVSIPFFPYHIGNNSIFGGEARPYIESLLQLPNICGMKLTTQNLYEISLMHVLSEGRLKLFSGADELLCQGAMCGTVGAIGSFYNIWGAECRKVRAAFLAGDIELGTKFMFAFQEAIHHVLPNAWSFFDQALKLKYDIELGIPNPPLGFCQSPWDENEVLALLKKVENAANGIDSAH
ncbi:N-acetylneuraminate lyase [Ravibacter arvi]|uniref:N-acetylneuraminate lyase n=1 Tax=Ravibacter arvi TaxID=2051041 RepID=A0ABP8M624_9BACT